MIIDFNTTIGNYIVKLIQLFFNNINTPNHHLVKI